MTTTFSFKPNHAKPAAQTVPFAAEVREDVASFDFGPRGATQDPAQHTLQQEPLVEQEPSRELVSKDALAQQIELARETLRAELEAEHAAQLEALHKTHQASIMTLADEMQRWREAMTHQSTEFLLRLIESLTMHLVQRSLIEHPESYVDAVTPALKELMGFATPRLYVPEFALDTLIGKMEELKGRHPDHINVEICADPNLSAGDYRFEVEGGSVQADLEKRLAHLVNRCRDRALAEFAEWSEEEEEHV